MVYYDHYDSPLGRLYLRGDEISLTGLSFESYLEAEAETPRRGIFAPVKVWLDAYFAGNPIEVNFILEPEGTAFQKRIWKMLLEIPYGHSRSYGDLAREAAKQMGKERISSQAVGQAVGRNPIAVIIPCHRVLGEGKRLTGYAYGLGRKQWLLEHEKIESRG